MSAPVEQIQTLKNFEVTDLKVDEINEDQLMKGRDDI